MIFQVIDIRFAFLLLPAATHVVEGLAPGAVSVRRRGGVLVNGAGGHADERTGVPGGPLASSR